MTRLPTHRPPIGPGELLRDVLEDEGLSQLKFASLTQMPPQRLSEIIHGHRRLTAESACRIAAVLGTTPGMWMNLQQAVDLWEAQEKEADLLATLVPLAAVESWQKVKGDSWAVVRKKD